MINNYSIRTKQWHSKLSVEQKEAIEALVNEIKSEHRNNATIGEMYMEYDPGLHFNISWEHNTSIDVSKVLAILPGENYMEEESSLDHLFSYILFKVHDSGADEKKPLVTANIQQGES